MAMNEIKQEVLALLNKGGAATAREIAQDLFFNDKPEKARLNRALTEMQTEGMIESTKTEVKYTPGMVNQYSITPEGIDAIEPGMDLDEPKPVELPPPALPDHEVLKAEREAIQNQASETLYLLVFEGEKMVFNNKHEAQQKAREYSSECGAKVQYYELSASLIGVFKPVTKVEFIHANQLNKEAA